MVAVSVKVVVMVVGTPGKSLGGITVLIEDVLVPPPVCTRLISKLVNRPVSATVSTSAAVVPKYAFKLP
jgi:hypothetical protein